MVRLWEGVTYRKSELVHCYFCVNRLNACEERHTMQISIGLPRNDGVNAGDAIAAVSGCAV